MPLGTNAANRAAGSLAAVRALVIQERRRGLRGKNDSVRPPGIHRPQCICVCQPDLAHFDTQIWPPCETNNPCYLLPLLFSVAPPERSPAPLLLRRVRA